MPSIDISADSSEAERALTLLNDKLALTSDRMASVSKSTAVFNKDGQQLSSVIEGITKAGDKLTATFAVLRDSEGKLTDQLEVTKIKYAENSAAMAKQVAAAAALVTGLKQSQAAEIALQASIQKTLDVRTKTNSAGLETSRTLQVITNDGRQATITYNALTEAEQRAASAAGLVSSGMRFAGASFKPLVEEVSKVKSAAEHLGESFDRLKSRAASFATFRFLNFVNNGLQEGIEEAKKFQIEISKIRTLSQDSSQQTPGKFGQDVRGVSDRTGIDLNEISKATYDTVSNQVAKGAEASKFVETAAQLARLTGSTTTDTVNLLSSRINAFGLTAKDADKVAAQFFRTIDEGRVVASEMANTIGRVDVLARGLGIGMEDVNSILAITTQKGFKTADAITLLTNFMIKLEKPTQAMSGYFKSIGAESGEAAIKIKGGVLPLFDEIVTKVERGELALADTFDEIRGLKAARALQQSLPEVKAFSAKLKDTDATTKIYEGGKAIRGESDADKLIIETNKLKNIFKADIGQEIVRFFARVTEASGGVDEMAKRLSFLTPALQLGTVALGTYSAAAVVMTARNLLLSKSFYALHAGAAKTATILAYLVAAIGTYKVATSFLEKDFDSGLKVDPKAFDAQGAAIDAMTERWKKFNETSKSGGPEADNVFTNTTQKIGDGYTELQRIIARALVANDGLLDQAKEKSKAVSDALKLNFTSWTDTLRGRISDIKKSITEANAEIEKSKKAVLSSKDSGDSILLNDSLKYANDDFGLQKQVLLKKSMEELIAKGEKAFGTGTKEGAEEGRHFFSEAQQRAQQLQDAKVEQDKRNLERNGGGVLFVDRRPLEEDLARITEKQLGLELKLQGVEKARADLAKENAKIEEDRLHALTKAFDKYTKIDITNKDGSVKDEFKDKNGKFDKSKLDEALKESETEITKNFSGSGLELLQLHGQFLIQRKALSDEARLKEADDELKTQQVLLATEEKNAKASIERIKGIRENLSKDNTTQRGILSGAKEPATAFFNKVAESGILGKNDTGILKLQELLDKAKKADDDLAASKVKLPNSVITDDPAKIDAVTKAYAEYYQYLQKIRDMFATQSLLDQARGIAPQKVDLDFTDSEGKKRTAAQAAAAVGEAGANLKDINQKQRINAADEKGISQLGVNVQQKVDALNKLFPDLKASVSDFTKSANIDLNKLSNDGLQKMIDQLQKIKDLTPAAGPGKQQGLLESGDVGGGGDFGPAYAAEGGIAGLFPGQPRGLDRYPIWAAAGETIINSRSSAEYKPMLEAIQNRRMPQYMAAGGRVGGDTHVGDITVHVNGGANGAETATIIGKRLERDLKRGVIKLNRGRK